MDRREYDKHEIEISKWLIKYSCDNDIDKEWMNRLLLDVLQGYVVKFDDKNK